MIPILRECVSFPCISRFVVVNLLIEKNREKINRGISAPRGNRDINWEETRYETSKTCATDRCGVGGHGCP